MNNKGQEILVGIMIMVMAMIVFVATIPAIKSIMDTSRQAQYLNCGGYVNADESKSANSSLEEDTLACTILDLGIPYLILGVLVGLIGKLIHGKMTEAPQQSYQDYGMAGGY